MSMKTITNASGWETKFHTDTWGNKCSKLEKIVGEWRCTIEVRSIGPVLTMKNRCTGQKRVLMFDSKNLMENVEKYLLTIA